MDSNNYKLESIWKEIEIINNKINHFDDLRLRTKQLAIVLWVAFMGFSLKNDTNLQILLSLSWLLPIPFWYMDASYRKYYKGWEMRFQALRHFIRNGSYKLPNGNIEKLEDLVNSPGKSKFPIFDYWGHYTIDSKIRKKQLNIFKSIFNIKVFLLYYAMIYISFIIASRYIKITFLGQLMGSIISIVLLIISIIITRTNDKSPGKKEIKLEVYQWFLLD